MILENERDIRGSREDENSVETIHETCVIETVSIEHAIQRMCQG